VAVTVVASCPDLVMQKGLHLALELEETIQVVSSFAGGLAAIAPWGFRSDDVNNG
jgi:hypothetical protein